MRIGLSLDEFTDLKMCPHARADRVFHQAAEEAVEQLFPMATVAVANHLRSRGYDVRAAMLDVLVESGTVVLAEPGVWTEADVETAANYFEAAGMLVPYAMTCEVLGCCYGDFLRPWRDRASAHSLPVVAMTSVRKAVLQPHFWRFMARLCLPGCCLRSDSVKRYSHATLSLELISRVRDSSSRYVTSRDP